MNNWYFENKNNFFIKKKYLELPAPWLYSKAEIRYSGVDTSSYQHSFHWEQSSFSKVKRELTSLWATAGNIGTRLSTLHKRDFNSNPTFLTSSKYSDIISFWTPASHNYTTIEKVNSNNYLIWDSELRRRIYPPWERAIIAFTTLVVHSYTKSLVRSRSAVGVGSIFCKNIRNVHFSLRNRKCTSNQEVYDRWFFFR